MEEIELKIIKKINDEYNAVRRGVNSDLISRDLELDYEYVLDLLTMLEKQGYVKLSTNGRLYSAWLTPEGHLLLTHPEYMLSKGYMDAKDVLNALEMAVTNSPEIPVPEKTHLVTKIKELSHDPYIQSIGSGLIVEAFKKLVGI